MTTGIRSKRFTIVRGGKWYRALLAGSSALALTIAAGPVLAQNVDIDNGDHEIVDGTGPGTQPSPWVINGSVFVGYEGTGELTIQNGGQVVSTPEPGYIAVAIGHRTHSGGTVIVSGTDADGNASTWTNHGNLNVGNLGTGTLTILNGGQVSSTRGNIGRSSGSDGTVIVSGTDTEGNASTWTNHGNLNVGNFGTGTLTISGGGVVNVAEGARIADHQGTSSATVQGDGSQWSINGDLSVGFGLRDTAQGTLTIENGGLVTSGATYLGAYRAEASGAIALNGNGVLATGLVEKGLGSGTLSFDGGILRATSNEADFLRNFDAGDVTIDAGGAVFDTNGFEIGIATDLQGTGGLTKAEGGTLTLTGDNSYQGGTLIEAGTLTGNANSFGASDIEVLSGANLRFEQDGDATLENSILGVGNVTKEGLGTLTLTGENSMGRLYIGRGAGAPWLDLLDGGAIRLADGAILGGTYLHIGGVKGRGALLLEGGDTHATFSNNALIGQGGEAELRVSGGAVLENNEGRLGEGLDSHAIATVSGQGSLWHNRGELHIGGSGSAGEGHLLIESDGRVESGVAQIGYGSGAVGNVTVTESGSTWETQGEIEVGRVGTGSFMINDGATVTSHTNTSWMTGQVARFWDSTGTVSIREGASWINDGAVIVGGNDGAEGHLMLSSDGRLQTGVASSDWDFVRLADSTNSSGTLNIGAIAGEQAMTAGVLDSGRIEFGDGTATLNFNHTDDDYVFTAALASAGSGTHSLNHYAGMTSLAADNSAFTGTTTVSGGTLLVDDALGGTMTVENGGTLGGSGIIGDTTVADGGIFAPGNSIGALTVDGDLTLSSGSILDVEIGSPGATPGLGASDRIDVAGDVALNGTLNLSQSDDATDGTAGFGYYRLMTYGGDLTGGGLTIGDTPALSDAADYEIQTDSDNVDLFIAASDKAGDDTLQHWQGGNGTWNANDTTWLNAGDGAPAGEIAVAWADNHAVFRNEPGGFDGGTITVLGTQSFRGLQFLNAGYRLEGEDELVVDGSDRDDGNAEIRVLADSAEIATEIAGTGGITKTQDGTLILSGHNSYQGGTSILGGSVQVSEDASLGAAPGGLTLNGGTLVTTADMDSARSITLSGVGGFDVVSATTLGLTGTIDGAGDLHKQGDGTLVLTGTNDYEGDTLVNAGTLVGNVAAIRGNIGNGATLVFDQIDDAAFAGDIGGLGGTYGKMIKSGGGELTLAGTSTLDWTIADGGLVSAADRFAGNVEIGGDGAFTFDQENDAGYASILSGAGDVTKNGDGVLLLSGDSSGFTGTTTITGGALLMDDADGNGMLGGSLDVLNGGTLGGSGTVGSGPGSLVTVASGGTLSPGTSIGTLTVDGDLVFAAGAHFAVEVNPNGAESDLVDVTGMATLDGGSVAHIGADGEYDIRSTYTILSTGTLSGGFEDVTSDFAFLNPDLSYDYDAGTVDLEFARNDRGFASTALTRNQIATAEAIESIGFDTGNAVYDAIAQLSDDDDLIRASFDAPSGEIHASAQTALIEDARFVRNAANDRIRAAFATAGASHAPVLAYGSGDTPVLVAADHAGPVFWSQGFGSWGTTDSDGNAAHLDRSTSGVLIGADGLVGDWRVGLLAGYSQSSFDAEDRASSGSSSNYHLGLYGGTEWGNVVFRTGAAYSWHDIEISRSVVIPGLTDSLSADYNAGTFQAFGELAYGFERNPRTRLEPFANLAHVSVLTDGFTESVGISALSVDSSTTGVTFTTLGLRGEHSLTRGTVDATLRGMIGWRHAFGDAVPESTHAFSVGDAFTIGGAPIARNSAVIEAGLDLSLTPEATFGLSYQGQIASDAHDHGVKANLSIRF
ncbi:autotransporter domain-containing protein [Qingshengfaniella alkalisoli]|uniref:Autotransporter outer membrane beta-barrel domain-containing protein n=1 Tax=Qingshengfaniella alkalisoli TaxID=2599296 RepID=A0A5B8J3W1_9RHOB|nr:autotransporter domain-containing protein [Qingshengfaniella alkalisoli]QDY71398.1 autotransporter outer membrane beta-barrel domain-containing protein [Qingshengfaniella alkalisoli]